MMPSEAKERARELKALVLDVDGVLTDGGMYVTDSGEGFKRFDVRDGLGIVSLIRKGIRVAWISSDASPSIKVRARKLGVSDVFTGVSDKRETLANYLESNAIEPEHTAYVGDDMADLEPMQLCGLAISVPDATPAVRDTAHWVTERRGGHGAVREICDAILENS